MEIDGGDGFRDAGSIVVSERGSGVPVTTRFQVVEGVPPRDYAVSPEIASIAKLALSLVQAEGCLVALSTPGALDPICIVGLRPEDIGDAADFDYRTALGTSPCVAYDATSHRWFQEASSGVRRFRFHMAVPMVGADGRPIGVVAVMDRAPRCTGDGSDVAALTHLAGLATKLVEHDEALRGRDAGFAGVFQHVPEPLLIYGIDSLRILDVNKAAVEAYGYSRERFLGMSAFDIRPEADRARALAAIKERACHQKAQVWRHRKADGTEFDVITSGNVIRYGGEDAMLVIAQDRTHIDALRKDLDQTRLLLDTIIDSLPVGVFMKDMQDDGRYVIYNAATGELVGRDCADIRGRTDLDVFGEEQGHRFAAQDQAVMAGGAQVVYEDEPVQRPGGAIVRARTVKKPLPTTDGSVPRYLVGITEDITARKDNEACLAHLATHDCLTGLPNRMLFRQRLDRVLARKRKAKRVAILYIDLDFFKTVNDSYGHHVGDELLKQVADRLRTCTRSTDVVARLGGDEFAVLTILGSDAVGLAERILGIFDHPFELGECTADVDASIGIAIEGTSGSSAETLMRHADIALYAAKDQGRGAARVYERQMSRDIDVRQMMSEDLRVAIDGGQFELDYQPILGLRHDRITGFEALVRWRHPTRGLISPVEFIPYAEKTGLMDRIGEWVLRTACEEATNWPEAVKVAVNLSAVQFRRPGLVEMVTKVLGETGLRSSRLELEITESVFLADNGENVQTLHGLRNLGIKIAMDDFGTGYSSLSYLRDFPFDKIKMDRRFVTNVCESIGSLAIARAVAGLGSSLAMTTTAEGIETMEQVERLKAEGFDELQGYLIGLPSGPAHARVLAWSAWDGGDGFAIKSLVAA